MYCTHSQNMFLADNGDLHTCWEFSPGNVKTEFQEETRQTLFT